MFKKIIITLVKLYQKFLSPDHSLWAKSLNKPPYCKHIPTCSEYMIEAVEKKGVVIGSVKGIARIFRCMPWNKGGYDPVEKGCQCKKKNQKGIRKKLLQSFWRYGKKK